MNSQEQPSLDRRASKGDFVSLDQTALRRGAAPTLIMATVVALAGDGMAAGARREARPNRWSSGCARHPAAEGGEHRAGGHDAAADVKLTLRPGAGDLEQRALGKLQSLFPGESRCQQ